MWMYNLCGVLLYVKITKGYKYENVIWDHNFYINKKKKTFCLPIEDIWELHLLFTTILHTNNWQRNVTNLNAHK